MYAALGPAHYTGGQITERFVRALGEGGFEPSLFNTFEDVAFELLPELKVYRERLQKLGAPEVHLAGSGSTLFAIFEDKARAENLHDRCRSQGMDAYLVETLNP